MTISHFDNGHRLAEIYEDAVADERVGLARRLQRLIKSVQLGKVFPNCHLDVLEVVVDLDETRDAPPLKVMIGHLLLVAACVLFEVSKDRFFFGHRRALRQAEELFRESW